MNTLVYGFHWKSQEDAIKNLENKNLISVKLWIGKRKYNDILLDNFIQGKIPKELYSGLNSELYTQVFNESFSTYLDMFSRSPNQYVATHHDKLNTFNYQFDYISNLLITKKIELIIYQNLPHMGNDYILYSLAKHMNIKMIMINQSLIPNRFSYVTNIDDFGSFKTSKIAFNFPHQNVDFSHKKILFYMKNIKIKFKSCNFNVLIDLLKYIIRSNTTRTFIGLIKRYIDCLHFQYNYTKYQVNNIDFTKKFVYFPLQLQPELTTSTLGGIYSDQLLAIERLSTMIPDDWQIYVKENPKQLERYRSNSFFLRLSLITNAKYISKTVNSFELIEKSQFVSTITGTAGWEAIRSDKSCLVFGKTWYQNFDGIFVYTSTLDYKEVAEYKIDKEQVEKDYNTFLKYTANGIVDKAYIKNFQEFNETDNTNYLTDSLLKIINSVKDN